MTKPDQSPDREEELSLEEVQRMVEKAREDEPDKVAELVRRLVLSTIDEIRRSHRDGSGDGSDDGSTGG